MAAKANEGGSSEASRRLASEEKGKNRAVRRKSDRLLVPEDKKQPFEDELISAFLTKSTEQARSQIADKGNLSMENAIPLMLKSQYNHIAHLDEQMVTKTEFNGEIKNLKEQMVTKTEFNEEIKNLKEQMVTKTEFNGEIKSLKEQMVTKTEFNGLKEQFNGLKEQFNALKDQVGFMKWLIMLGFALLAALQVYTSFIK